MLQWLLKWKNSADRMPLLLNGARQVGKSYLGLMFGKTHYKNLVYVNFEGNTEFAKIFERDLNPQRIITEISLKTGQNIFENDTLIFFDEIQTCEKALTSLKYFCEDAPHYHIIAAGSLLGVAINRETFSFPVGKVEMKTLYPLDFEEYLWAISGKEMADQIRDSFNNSREFSLHLTALDLYRSYLVVGGMPSAVNEFVEKKDFDYVGVKQKNIFDSYVADMAKYATPFESTRIMESFNSIPFQLAKENKKFQYKVIKNGARAYQYEGTIDWLKASGVINKILRVNEAKLPLKIFADNTSYKIFMTDVGLLSQEFGIPAVNIISEGEGYVNFKGALTENYVASALVFAGFSPFYWESSGKAEVDFVIQTKACEILN